MLNMKLKVIKKTNILIILSSIVLALVAGKVFYTSIITNKIVSKKKKIEKQSK